VLHAWRHPRVDGTRGLCLGRTDLPVDPRRAKRLAHRIRRFARVHRLPHVVRTSPLQRCRDVGRWLARWGWRHVVDADLAELDFGRWDGRPWAEVPKEEIDAWCSDFARHAPGGGEPVAGLLQRVARCGAGVAVTHGGWLSAALWREGHGDEPPDSTQWPPAPAPGAHTVLCCHRR